MNYFLFVLSIFFSTHCLCQSINSVIRIEENHLYGFIDEQGTVLISPKFHSAGEYSEGLIAARMDGLYGYVDKKGKWVIKPQFDFATDFREGLAVVINDNIPFYINRKGKPTFNTNFAKVLSSFDDGFAIFRTNNGRLGMLNRKGEISIDTVYIQIENLGCGLYKVYPIKGEQNWDYFFQVIDTIGNLIIPVGKYDEIGQFKGGYAKVKKLISKDLPKDSNTLEGFVDTKGNLLIQRMSDGYHELLSNEIQNGIGIVMLSKVPPVNDYRLLSYNTYPGYFNKNGDVVFDDGDVLDATPFSNNRAFVHRKSSGYSYSLIDIHFNRLSDIEFNDVSIGFQNGYAIVEIDNDRYYSLIDTTGKVIFRNMFFMVEGPKIIDNYFFFQTAESRKSLPWLYGIAEVTGKILVEPLFEDFDKAGFKNGVLKVVIGGNECLINKSGKVVWKKKEQSFLQEFNIDHMMKGHFYAYSEPDTLAFGGYGESDNHPRLVRESQDFPENQIFFSILTDQIDTFRSVWKGYKVILANTTKENMWFDAQDSRLSIITEAKDKDGKWKKIDYLQSSFCGNSSHRLTLKSNTLWEFKIPKYEGAFATTLRLKFSYDNPKRNYNNAEESTITIYSNEIKVRINRSQFWRKKTYTHSGIMNPYWD